MNANFPAHPDGWFMVVTRRLHRNEQFEINQWLRLMTQSKYDLTPCAADVDRLQAFFSAKSDAVLFKLTWGGPQ